MLLKEVRVLPVLKLYSFPGWNFIVHRGQGRFPNRPLVSGILAFQVHYSYSPLSTYYWWIRPQGFLHLGTVTLHRSLSAWAVWPPLSFASVLTWAHGIWLTILHGNAISSCSRPRSLQIFHTDTALDLYQLSQSLNIMVSLDSSLFRGTLYERQTHTWVLQAFQNQCFHFTNVKNYTHTLWH